MKEIRTDTITLNGISKLLDKGIKDRFLQVDKTKHVCEPQTSKEYFLNVHPSPAYHMDFLWNPYTDKALVTSRHPEPINSKTSIETRNLFRGLPIDITYQDYQRPKTPDDPFINLFLDESLETIAASDHPHGAKILEHTIDNAIQILKDESYIDYSFKVFRAISETNSIPGLGATISVPLKDNMWIKAIHTISETLKAQPKRMTGPTSLRFVPANITIPMADPVDVCKFEFLFGGTSSTIQKIMNDIIIAVDVALCSEFGQENVRFHWGQYIPYDRLSLKRLVESYPKLEVWRNLQNKFDPSKRGYSQWQKKIFN